MIITKSVATATHAPTWLENSLRPGSRLKINEETNIIAKIAVSTKKNFVRPDMPDIIIPPKIFNNINYTINQCKCKMWKT